MQHDNGEVYKKWTVNSIELLARHLPKARTNPVGGINHSIAKPSNGGKLTIAIKQRSS